MLLVLVLMQQLQQAEKLQQQPRQQNANKYVKNLHVCHHLLSALPPPENRGRGDSSNGRHEIAFLIYCTSALKATAATTATHGSSHSRLGSISVPLALSSRR